MLEPYTQAGVAILLEEGASPQQVDKARSRSLRICDGRVSRRRSRGQRHWLRRFASAGYAEHADYMVYSTLTADKLLVELGRSRPEDRERRLVRLQAGRSAQTPSPNEQVNVDELLARQSKRTSRRYATQDQQRGDCRPPRLSRWSMKARRSSRRGIAAARIRHRRGLSHGLWISADLPWRGPMFYADLGRPAMKVSDDACWNSGARVRTRERQGKAWQSRPPHAERSSQAQRRKQFQHRTKIEGRDAQRRFRRTFFRRKNMSTDAVIVSAARTRARKILSAAHST